MLLSLSSVSLSLSRNSDKLSSQLRDVLATQLFSQLISQNKNPSSRTDTLLAGAGVEGVGRERTHFLLPTSAAIL